MNNFTRSKVSVSTPAMEPTKPNPTIGSIKVGTIFRGRVKGWLHIGSLYLKAGTFIVSLDSPGEWFSNSLDLEILDFQQVDLKIETQPHEG